MAIDAGFIGRVRKDLGKTFTDLSIVQVATVTEHMLPNGRHRLASQTRHAQSLVDLA
jgi:hypothetical protein